jgi:hypothetical protein
MSYNVREEHMKKLRSGDATMANPAAPLINPSTSNLKPGSVSSSTSISNDTLRSGLRFSMPTFVPLVPTSASMPPASQDKSGALSKSDLAAFERTRFQ